MQGKFSKLLILLCFHLLSSIYVFAADGYKIQVHYKDAKDSLVYLLQYYGRSTDIFKLDSARIDAKGNLSFSSTKPITGGIHMLMFAGKSSTLEFVLLNGDNLTFETAHKEVYLNTTSQGSEENITYLQYQRYLVDFGKEFKALEAELKNTKTRKDSDVVIEKLNGKHTKLQAYRESLMKDHPKLFLSKLFRCIKEPQVPEPWPKLANGKRDSLFPIRYRREHFWDNFDFNDNRIIYTPVFETKLDNFFTYLVYPSPDSVNYEADKFLKKVKNAKEIYKYSLWYLTKWTETSRVMAIDESYVYLIENYYMKGLAPWVDSVELNKHFENAQRKSPLMIGAKIKDLTVRDSSGTQKINLYSIPSQYTLLLFWSPNCSHCQTELPQFDSVLNGTLKNQSITILAITTENELDKWKAFIRKNQLKNRWLHAYDPSNSINFKANYDVYTTPTLYLLDKDKRIKAKRLDHKGLVRFLQNLEENKSTPK